MILQALYKLAQDEQLIDDPDYEWRPIAWLVHVDKGGRLLGIEGTHFLPNETSKGRGWTRPVPKRFLVPREESRTSGDKAFLLFDKAEYVFGADPDGKRSSQKLAARFTLFCKRVSACAADTHDEAVEAVDQLLDELKDGRQTIALPENCAGNNLFAFVYGPDPEGLVTDRKKVRTYWKRLRAAGRAEGTSRCLVTGAVCASVDKHPPIKRVPGGSTSGVLLVSYNKSAFESHGWERNENAPISRGAAEACSAALNRLLDNAPRNAAGTDLPLRSLRLSGDTVVCYWGQAAGGREFLDCFAGLLAADPQVVAEVYRGIWRGVMPSLADPSAFYAMTLSGGQGRAMVRDWLESTVADVAGNVAAHFRDLDVVRNTPPPKARGLPPQIPLRVLLQSLAPLGKDDAIPAPLATRLLRAVLQGAEYPISLLQRAIGRMRAEIGRSEWSDLDRRDARVALVKAILNRRRRFRTEMQTRYREITKAMDATNTNPGYLLGRLLAITERMQQLAMGDINASVVDRFFSGASAAPKAVFPRLMKNLRHHARKAMDDDKSRSTVHWLEGQVDEIMSQMDGFPSHLDLENQGLFIVGYHHMRHWLWMSKEQRALLSAEAAAGV